MVILDHVDVGKLNLKNFRKFNCPCELCDCGCFERMKQKHVANCKRQKIPTKDKLIPHSSLACPLSHYKETFKSNPNFRPPTAYVPPQVPLEKYVPQVPMDFNTVQKLEFKGQQTERTKAYKIIDKYEPPKEPLDATTMYQNDYLSKDYGYKNEIIKKNPNVQTMILSTDKFSDKTTAKEHFKQWNQKGPVKAFNEWPSFAGESLFPTSERNFSTTTASFHPQFENIEKTKALARIENNGVFPLNVPMDMNTNYRNTYVKYQNTERTKAIDPSKKSDASKATLVPMQSTTQTRSDYIHYKNFQKTQPADVDTYVSDLNRQLYPNNIHDLTTSYAKEYKGHDTKKHPKAQLCKKEPDEYKLPTEKIDAETVTMRDFKPIDVTQIPRLKIIKATPKIKITDEPMESLTTSKKHFIKYDVKPVQLASDPFPNYYIPNKEKFINNKTTNEETYYAKVAEKIRTYRPDNHFIERNGSIDFNSNYRNEFIDHGLTMCEAKAYFLAEALKKQEQEQQTTDNNSRIASSRLTTANGTRKKSNRIPSSTQFSSNIVAQVS